MDSGPVGSQQQFRLWIATYGDWRPTCWSDLPPGATAVELVEDRLYSAEEAAMFVAGFNSQVLGGDKPVWAVAVPVTIRYLGDAEPGALVRGHAFARESLSANLTAPIETESASLGIAPLAESAPANPLGSNQPQGFDQSPQRSR
jgi:hypothetical protein